MRDRFCAKDKKFELMLTRRAKAYSSSGSVVTHRSTNRARRRVTSFQSKRVINYATPPTPVSWRHLVNDIDLRSPKSLKSLTPPAPGSMNLGDQDLDCWNLRLMLKISYADCLGLSPAISSQFSVEMCAASKSCEKFTKTSFWGVQGRSRSSMLINPKSLSPVLVMISCMYVPIYNRFHIIRANNGKMTSF